MEKIYDILIIGGGVGGMSAAVYAKRRGKSVAVIEKFALGGQLNMINEIENFPSHKNIDGITLAKEFADQVKKFEIDVIFDEVQSVDFSGDVKVLNGKKNVYKSKSVIIATGVKSKEIGVNENDFLGRGVSFCAVCDANFYKGKDVCVASENGKGLKGAMELSELCNSVTLLDSGNLSAFAKVNKNEKIMVISNASVKRVLGQFKVEKLAVSVGGQEQEIAADALFIELGKIPATDIFKGQLRLDDQGFIVTDERMHTSAKEVYAIGDVRSGVLKQIVTACSDGAVAGQFACQK